MLTITKALLDAFPNWGKAGWKVGDKVNVVNYLQSLRDNVNLHPPKRPGGVK